MQSLRGLGIKFKTCKILEEEKVSTILASALNLGYINYEVNCLCIDCFVLNYLN